MRAPRSLEAEPIDLRTVVHRVIGGAEPLAERKGSRILVVGDDQPVIAEADARRVERVLRNLVVNAVEHGEGRDVVVRMGVAQGAVAVAVRDYGVGLKPGEATRVFNRFWRADPARARPPADRPRPLHRGRGRPAARRLAPGLGRARRRLQFRLTLPRTADEPLRGSPIPLEPEDSRRNRESRERDETGAGTSVDHRLTSVPPQPGARGAFAAARARPWPRRPERRARRCTPPRCPATEHVSWRARPRNVPVAWPAACRIPIRRTPLVGTDRRPGGHGRAVRMTALLGCGVVVLVGCGSMPVTGDVKAVDASQPGDSQVQVYAVAPRRRAAQ